MIILEEDVVPVVIKIVSKYLSFIISFTIGIIDKLSPTLAACIQTNLFEIFLICVFPYLSFVLQLVSFPSLNRLKIINGINGIKMKPINLYRYIAIIL